MEKQLPLAEPHFLREKMVRKYIPVSKEGLRNMVRRGDIPAPRRIGPKVVVWDSRDILAFIENAGLEQAGNMELVG